MSKLSSLRLRRYVGAVYVGVVVAGYLMHELVGDPLKERHLEDLAIAWEALHVQREGSLA